MTPAEQNLHDIVNSFCAPRVVREVCPDVWRIWASADEFMGALADACRAVRNVRGEWLVLDRISGKGARREHS